MNKNKRESEQVLSWLRINLKLWPVLIAFCVIVLTMGTVMTFRTGEMGTIIIQLIVSALVLKLELAQYAAMKKTPYEMGFENDMVVVKSVSGTILFNRFRVYKIDNSLVGYRIYYKDDIGEHHIVPWLTMKHNTFQKKGYSAFSYGILNNQAVPNAEIKIRFPWNMMV